VYAGLLPAGEIYSGPMITMDRQIAGSNLLGWMAACCLSLLLSGCSEVPATVTTIIQPRSAQIAFTAETLKVMSLNIAHGRKDGINQLFLSRSTIRKNLDEIAAVLVQKGADVIALQEADAPSRWSGHFDHIGLLAEQADYPAVVHTAHAHSWLFNYGTAILSKADFTETLNYTFEPSPPTLNKGFTLAQIVWQPRGQDQVPVLLDIVSVHLDFSRKQIRERQIREITEALEGRDNPLIILGDFNSDWLADERVVRALAKDNGLQGYRPAADDLATYPSGNKRLDWILISNTLEFIRYEVLPDVLSDHKAVFAEIGLVDRPQQIEAGMNQHAIRYISGDVSKQ
jgi:endonuclease/exonuclease/phosphatase family metal-dependent hydrolase